MAWFSFNRREQESAQQAQVKQLQQEIESLKLQLDNAELSKVAAEELKNHIGDMANEQD